ncbi:hypothetical protein Hanom_Chr02g00146221 [Helianthus anomalus]
MAYDLHFLGLLSLCLDRLLGFLVKSRISLIMGLSNLFVLKGNVETLRSLAEVGYHLKDLLPFRKRLLYANI